jgi:hypothetical protein
MPGLSETNIKTNFYDILRGFVSLLHKEERPNQQLAGRPDT